jgi:hypothetical protein
VLPSRDISASLPVLSVLTAMQAWDRLFGTEILLCAILRRREAASEGPEPA